MRGTMTAYRLVRWGAPPQLTEVPVPEPGPGEVLVEVAATGLCHSDLDMARMPGELGEALGWQVPFTLGHEVAGHVAALGPGVAGPPPGAAVVLVSPASCGGCDACRRGHDSACPHGTAGRGYGRDGGLARYVTAPARSVVPLIDGVDPVAAAPLTDAGATAHHAVDRVAPRLEPGSTAVVVGVGGVGAFAVQILRARTPARVVAVDVDPVRREVAADLGAHEVLPEVGALDGLGGAEVVLDVVGTDATIAAGLAAVRPYGAFGLVGAGGGTFRRPWFGGLPRDAEIFTFQGSSIADLRAVVALAAAGAVRSEVEVRPLSQVAAAYEALARGGLRGRIVVVPDDRA
ncbi:MAG TPA: alcohol dehydrogenase catalytic domain-containing protein [Acidimicrobiales bacterium]|nr:alcohol dehydrogenase catalytic domain-containing protein [Acidimicrobiales bacterium]